MRQVQFLQCSTALQPCHACQSVALNAQPLQAGQPAHQRIASKQVVSVPVHEHSCQQQCLSCQQHLSRPVINATLLRPSHSCWRDCSWSKPSSCCILLSPSSSNVRADNLLRLCNTVRVWATPHTLVAWSGHSSDGLKRGLAFSLSGSLHIPGCATCNSIV